MADVFISYKRERRPAARHLEQILIRYGYSVWFDLALVRGKDYEAQIERELTAAKAVIVLWCGLSVLSEGVRSEATCAKADGKLIPLVIEPCKLPLFSTLEQNVDLTSATGSPRDPAFDPVLDDLERLVGRPPQVDLKALRDYEATWRSMGALSLARLPQERNVAAEAVIGGGSNRIPIAPIEAEEDTRAYFKRGKAHLDENNYERAIADFTKVIEIDPKKAGAYLCRGIANTFKNNNDHAIADFTKVIEIDPKNAGAYWSRGCTYNRKGNFDRAIADFTKAIEIDPKYAAAYAGRGRSYHFKGDYDCAIADYNMAIELDPNARDAYSDRVKSYFGRSHSHLNKGDHDRAIADFNKIIETDPKNVGGYWGRGIAHYLKGDYDRAIADHTKAIEIDPKDAAAYFSRGRSYNRKGDHVRANADLTRAMKIDPKYSGANYD
jgi:tetratricopeptide (TPR) repeat protein